jgi:hypothetical protein
MEHMVNNAMNAVELCEDGLAADGAHQAVDERHDQRRGGLGLAGRADAAAIEWKFS